MDHSFDLVSTPGQLLHLGTQYRFTFYLVVAKRLIRVLTDSFMRVKKENTPIACQFGPACRSSDRPSSLHALVSNMAESCGVHHLPGLIYEQPSIPPSKTTSTIGNGGHECGNLLFLTFKDDTDVIVFLYVRLLFTVVYI